MESKILTTGETADMLRVTKLTVRKWANEGRLKGMRAGKSWRFNPEDIHAFLQNDLQQEPQKVA
ncbi:MAG: helix-turn-helix domain-containing protein [Armatimonadetes bacterium]|nr:helix-turn-helix domain-containing protein [Armatimonadota bacterium]